MGENLKELQTLMSDVGIPDVPTPLNCFTTELAASVVQYVQSTLFQHYSLFQYLFTEGREEETHSTHVCENNAHARTAPRILHECIYIRYSIAHNTVRHVLQMNDKFRVPHGSNFSPSVFPHSVTLVMHCTLSCVHVAKFTSNYSLKNCTKLQLSSCMRYITTGPMDHISMQL